MSQIKPTYHLPPNFSTSPPPEGPFHLGTVIRDFKNREQMRPLNQGVENRITIPQNLIYTDHKGGFEATRAKLKSGSLGFWAQFIAIDGLGIEASISGERSDNDEYKFETVDTEYFYPSAGYIAQCMKLPDVEDYLKAYNYKKPVYLITGLKTAKGVSVRAEKVRKVSGKVDVGLNNAVGSLGPRAEGAIENSPAFAFSESSDLVVGIQCLKLYYKSGLFGGEKKLKDELYTDGATFVDDEPKQQQKKVDDYIIADQELSVPLNYTYQSQNSGDGGGAENWALPL